MKKQAESWLQAAHDDLLVIQEIKDRIEKYIQLDIDTNIFDQINELYIDSRYPTDIGILPEGKPSTQNARDFFCFAQKLYDNTQDIINKSI